MDEKLSETAGVGNEHILCRSKTSWYVVLVLFVSLPLVGGWVGFKMALGGSVEVVDESVQCEEDDSSCSERVVKEWELQGDGILDVVQCDHSYLRENMELDVVRDDWLLYINEEYNFSVRYPTDIAPNTKVNYVAAYYPAALHYKKYPIGTFGTMSDDLIGNNWNLVISTTTDSGGCASGQASEHWCLENVLVENQEYTVSVVSKQSLGVTMPLERRYIITTDEYSIHIFSEGAQTGSLDNDPCLFIQSTYLADMVAASFSVVSD